MKQESTEQRKNVRIKVHVPLSFRKLRDGAGVQGVSSISKNLSGDGVCFRTSQFVSMACRLILELDIPKLEKPIKAISKVTWIRKTGSGTEYEIGNRFLEMSKIDKANILKYVDRFKIYSEETPSS
ncbi:MAG: PilZ domain-containing protein [Candidatus Omnitrophica bacterium]|nr:PilZ domain-containing protein [Candidatus Omnitrophota bacterium]